MKKILFSGLIAGIVLLILGVLALHITVWVFPGISMEYFNPAFDIESMRITLYYLHPFVVSLALSWFWARFKSVLTGSFLTRGIEFGLIYTLVATVPMMWLIYSSINVSLGMVFTWLILALVQGMVAGLVFEKMNP